MWPQGWSRPIRTSDFPPETTNIIYALKVWTEHLSGQAFNGALLKFETIQVVDSTFLSRQVYAVPDLCCILSGGLVELVGGVFDPVVNSAIAVFEHVKDELAVIPCLLLATL